ncbi:MULTISPECIES: very short patch repair endonuclease [Xenorhabdus]|uniref:very short patch repair endonuclease n=1 Tax=Xenorhabdus TaxID=626 RepID=UPI00064A4FBB|nr:MULTISPECIES: DNA mismatch endonuclease Vsr [Xenorhabdus]KLU13967.1 very short patch repair endonuclease [Xenorhabdus griffiniae]KOP35149.1 very short patch repair endonuclease [Xenorhabdus sp. GDc328]WFQ79655.1 DNA mismatch endonuclease Vsr [Xenorhabdus sp. SF857]
MADVHPSAIRSKNMKAIRNCDTAIEIKLAAILEDAGFQFRTQVKELPGKPDFVIDEYRKIIFTHGCFWHHHECYLFKVPMTRTEFWMNKFEKNVLRDKAINEKLRSDGWHVMVIWECAIKGRFRLPVQELSERIEEWICAGSDSVEIDTKGIHNKNV